MTTRPPHDGVTPRYTTPRDTTPSKPRRRLTASERTSLVMVHNLYPLPYGSAKQHRFKSEMHNQ